MYLFPHRAILAVAVFVNILLPINPMPSFQDSIRYSILPRPGGLGFDIMALQAVLSAKGAL
jgi:hypothetical protein